MAKNNISKLVTEGQIQRMHSLMDHGYSNLSAEDISLIDSVLDMVTMALHRDIPIHLKSTDRCTVNNVIYIDRIKTPSFTKLNQVQ